MVPLGHILSDKPRVTGCFGSQVIRHPCLGDPVEVDQSPTCVQAAQYTCIAPLDPQPTMRLSLLPHCCFWWLSSAVTPLCQGA